MYIYLLYIYNTYIHTHTYIYICPQDAWFAVALYASIMFSGVGWGGGVGWEIWGGLRGGGCDNVLSRAFSLAANMTLSLCFQGGKATLSLCFQGGNATLSLCFQGGNATLSLCFQG